MMRLAKFDILILAAVILCRIGYLGYRQILKELYPMDYSELVDRYAAENELSPALVYAVIKCESSFRNDAVSSVGALGLMQITPATFEWVQTKTGEDLEVSALNDPETNIRYGCRLLSMHLLEFGDERVALAAYHAGRGQVNEWLNDPEVSSGDGRLDSIPFTDTEHYVKKVMKAKERYLNLYKEELSNGNG